MERKILSRLEAEIDLLKRHLEILKLVIEKQPIGIIKLSEITGLPQHKVRYSLRILEQGNLIAPSTQGAICKSIPKEFFVKLSKRIEEISEDISNLNELINRIDTSKL